MKNNSGNQGYVYILEVKDIDLPVCKIGRTTKTPRQRCQQINKSSTGDFLWKVAYEVAVNDCIKLESAIHKKLEPLRQKNREFFNLKIGDAIAAVESIIENLPDINEIELPIETYKEPKRINFDESAYIYTQLFDDFVSYLGVKGRPFGQLNRPHFGISDGNNGVQWSLSVHRKKEDVQLSVNLEGLKYDNWPITTFILNELDNPSIKKVVELLADPGSVYMRFTRDAWQAAARPNILERHLYGSETKLSDMDNTTWEKMLSEALSCLDKNKGHRGRAKQEVTLNNKQKNKRIMEVSPHITIWTPVNFSEYQPENLITKFDLLRPIYTWVKRRIST